ncbi:MAG: OmpA family protein, partial [Candidatus Kapaibacteriota bacterium]
LDEKGNEMPVTVLKIEEFLSTKMHPLLGYIFFDENSAEIPPRYKLLSKNETKDFNIKKLYGLSTLDIYYHILNIIGKRVAQFPQAELTIVGCNSDQGLEKGNLELSRRRAEAVRNYFTNVWNIEPERIKIVERNLPENPSNPNDPDGIEENRRVEIIANIPQIFEPLVVEDTLREVNPPTFRFKTEVKTPIGVDRWQLVTLQSAGVVKVFEGKGDIPKVIEWKVQQEQSNVPKFDEPLKYKLVVYDKDNKKWESQTLELPVQIMTIEKKIVEQVADKQIDRFSLILFKFGQSDISGDNLKIAEIAKKRIKPLSTVKIEGFTDRIGNEQVNLELSTRRALETAKVLGVETRFAKGLGETRLLYDNNLPEGRFYCRTVNIEIVTPIE